MIKNMRESSLHVAVAGNLTNLDKKRRDKVESVFKDIFASSASKISEAEEENEVELVYEIKTPIIKDENLLQEFYENLEVLLEELREFTPHFTQFKRGDLHA